MGRIKMQFDYPDGATPLDPDETEGLIPNHITTQTQLNEWEQANILEAETWAFSTRHTAILSVHFILNLHRRMFNKTWHWAGKFRQSNKNIGTDKILIQIELKKLLDNTQFQIENSVYPIDEIAMRFHHRLVWIHLFANGNGRHSRLMTDILLVSCDQPRFSWGRESLYSKSEVRDRYIQALREADKYNYEKLLAFMRT
jgi:Fic-DOC domain mobile mystery protein B